MKMLILGMDGMDSNFVYHHRDALPTLKRFMTEGALRHVKSVAPPITGPAWFSIYTGLLPGAHGIKDWTWDKPDSNVAYTLADVKHPIFFELLSEAGYKVGTVHMPMTFPVRDINGFMVSGFPSPEIMKQKARLKDGMQSSLPPELRERYREVVVDLMDVRQGRRWDDLWPVEEEIITGRLGMVEELVAEYSPDVLSVGFTTIDRCYHGIMIDQNQPREAFAKKMMHWYKRADDIIAEMMGKYQPEDTVIISDHGGGWHAGAPGAPGHNFNAIFGGLGQSFAGGWFEHGRMLPCIAPTLLYVMGVPREKWAHMQGKVAREMLKENAEVMERLRALGYI